MTSEPLTLVINQIPADIDHLPLPTPFPVGPVNAYLLLGDPLTIVDPGMVWDDTTDQIAARLQTHGHTVVDIAEVVVTHGHPDHFGAAGWIAASSDAVVVAGRAEAPKLLGGFDRTHLGGMVADLGIPDEVRASFSSVWDVVRGMTHPIDPDRLWLVDDGDTLNTGGRTWQAHVTPGHTVGHLSLYDPTDRTLLSGDHLLACITPNPVLEPDTDTPHGRRRSLIEYLDSLERFCRGPHQRPPRPRPHVHRRPHPRDRDPRPPRCPSRRHPPDRHRHRRTDSVRSRRSPVPAAHRVQHHARHLRDRRTPRPTRARRQRRPTRRPTAPLQRCLIFKEPMEFDTYDPQVAELLASTLDGGGGLPAYLGIHTSDAGPGYMTAQVDIRSELLNPFGTVHGGVLAALTDHVLGAGPLPGHRARRVGRHHAAQPQLHRPPVRDGVLSRP